VCRQKRVDLVLSNADTDARYRSVMTLSLVEVPVLSDCRTRAWDYVLRLGLGSYDAHFVALAVLLGIELWTFDKPLWKAVQADPGLAALVKLIGVDVAP